MLVVGVLRAMLTIDFNIAISLLLTVPLAIVFILWIFYPSHKDTPYHYSAQGLHQCPYCTYLFKVFKTRQPLLKCPRCQSLISPQEEAEACQEKNADEKQKFQRQ
jgi:hypothetical protein